MNYISIQEFDRMIEENVTFQLIDLRETYEFEDHNIGGVNIPLDDLLNQKDKIATDRPVVFCCKSGKRSAAMSHTLKRKFNMANLFILQGGLELYLENKK